MYRYMPGGHGICAFMTTAFTGMSFFLQPEDAERTIAVNCGYIGTNDYVIEAGDREFLLRVSVCESSIVNPI